MCCCMFYLFLGKEMMWVKVCKEGEKLPVSVNLSHVICDNLIIGFLNLCWAENTSSLLRRRHFSLCLGSRCKFNYVFHRRVVSSSLDIIYFQAKLSKFMTLEYSFSSLIPLDLALAQHQHVFKVQQKFVYISFSGKLSSTYTCFFFSRIFMWRQMERGKTKNNVWKHEKA